VLALISSATISHIRICSLLAAGFSEGIYEGEVVGATDKLGGMAGMGAVEKAGRKLEMVPNGG
jgi:hypothetical protein